MCDDCPCPDPEEIEMSRSKTRVTLDQGVDEPHGHVGHEKEGHNLPTGLRSILLSSSTATPTGIEHEERLHGGLQKRKDFRNKAVPAARNIGFHCEVAPHYAEHGVNVDAALGQDQQGTV